MSTHMSSYLLTEAQIAAGGTFTSDAVNIEKASALAVHLPALTGTGPDISFTYSLSTSKNGTFIEPASPVTIGANISAVDVLDFAPEAASWIKIIVTNNNGAQTVTPTVVLAVQED